MAKVLTCVRRNGISMEREYIIPKGYKSQIDLKRTEVAIKRIKDFFENHLSTELNLMRVSAPLFIDPSTGMNDNLNGIERPVSFDAADIKDSRLEIVQSLAKWKRYALYRYGFNPGEGLYTDMNAVRRDEKLDNLHSLYVDQWDWEKVIDRSCRNIKFLQANVIKIYKVFKDTEEFVHILYPKIKPHLPDEVFFITTQELEDLYPELSPQKREDMICRKKKAVFLMQIGDTLKSGKKHDGRAPDYDDWQLNGDLLFYYAPFDKAFELSSMGIRVDSDSLKRQLEIEGCADRMNLMYHKMILDGTLPYTIGGGIGQSRICMFLLRKMHIGEVQASVWPKEIIEDCKKHGINIL